MSSDTESRYLQSRKVSLISFTINIVLGVAKIIIGITAGSKALIADGVHSFSDMASTAVILVSLRLSKQPPDSTHPYGHGKAEPIGTAILGSLLLITGGLLARDALFNMLSGDMSVPGGLALWGAVISIMTKELLYQYTVRIGRRINSKGLVADAHHHRSDALSSVAALIGIAGSRLGYPLLDPLAGLVVSLLILWVGFKILRGAINDLMDGIEDQHRLEELEKIADGVRGVIDVNDLKLRNYGPKLYVDITVVVKRDLSVAEGHQIAEKVRDQMIERGEDVREVMVHVDPGTEGESDNV